MNVYEKAPPLTASSRREAGRDETRTKRSVKTHSKEPSTEPREVPEEKEKVSFKMCDEILLEPHPLSTFKRPTEHLSG